MFGHVCQQVNKPFRLNQMFTYGKIWDNVSTYKVYFYADFKITQLFQPRVVILARIIHTGVNVHLLGTIFIRHSVHWRVFMAAGWCMSDCLKINSSAYVKVNKSVSD